MSNKVGLVGLGLMGSVLASKLIQAGFDVHGYDIDNTKIKEFEKKGGKPAGSPAGCVQEGHFAVLSLLHSGIVRDVCFGMDGLVEIQNRELLVIDTTTSRPEDSIETAEKLHKHGIGFLDASLSGSRDDIIAVVGGEMSNLNRARSIIKSFTRSCHYMGPNGSGARTKLIINLMSGLNRLVMAEGLVLGMKAGMEMESLLEVLKDSSAYSKAMAHRGERMIRTDYNNPSSRVHQHHKDVRLILEQGHHFNAPMLLSSVHQQILQAAESGGLGDADNAAVVEVLRRLGGLPPVSACPD